MYDDVTYTYPFTQRIEAVGFEKLGYARDTQISHTKVLWLVNAVHLFFYVLFLFFIFFPTPKSSGLSMLCTCVCVNLRKRDLFIRQMAQKRPIYTPNGAKETYLYAK